MNVVGGMQFPATQLARRLWELLEAAKDLSGTLTGIDVSASGKSASFHIRQENRTYIVTVRETS